MAEIDLNLLRTFVLLYRTRSVTKAAEELSVTQPSVSHGLKRLRAHFADDLFTRSASGLEPTQVATRLYPELQQALEVIDSAVRAVTTFDAGSSSRTFTLLATDLGEVALLPSILEAFRSGAPAARLEVRQLDFSTVETDLRQHAADAAICTPRIAAPDLNRDVLQQDRYVGLCASDHGRIGDRPTIDSFLAERHVSVAEASGHVDVDRALVRLGSVRDVAISVPHFSALPRLVAVTDLLGVIPASVSDFFCAQAAVRTFPLPFDVQPVEVSLYTYRRVLPSSASNWFRTVLCDAFGGPAGHSD